MSVIIPRFYTRSVLDVNTTTYNVTAGAENVLYPLSNAFDVGSKNAALPVTDANGVFSVDITVDTMADGWGDFPWGKGISSVPMDALILGVSRHDAALFRFPEGRVKLVSGGVILVDANLQGIPTNKNMQYDLPAHASNAYTLTLSNLPSDAVIVVPTLYLGSKHELIGIGYNYDPYQDKPHFDAIRLGNGGGYDKRRFIQFEAKPSYKYMGGSTLEATVDYLREEVFEKLKPFYYQFDTTQPTGVYLVKQEGGFAESPIPITGHRNLTLNLKEWLGE